MRFSTPLPHLSAGNGRFKRSLAYFLMAPVMVVILLSLTLSIIFVRYQNQHNDRIYTGVNIGSVDLSGLTREEAQNVLQNAFPYFDETGIVFIDPATRKQWIKTPSALGLYFDAATTVDNAYAIGREQDTLASFRAWFESWYYGRSLTPIFIMDEGQLDAVLSELAAEIYQPASNASFDLSGGTVVYTPSQTGRELNQSDIRANLQQSLMALRQAEIELSIKETQPVIYDEGDMAVSAQQIIEGRSITFYLSEPIDEFDLQPIILPDTLFKQWLQVEVVEQEGGKFNHRVFLDENAARHWLTPYAQQLYREPVNARYYFDDDTKELVLVSPHINGRELDIEATIAQLLKQVQTPNRSIPFIFKDIMPIANSSATAAELGITELISERTTWFYGSSDARKRNISRSAANFYGIVIAPGEEFSFNKYLGSISEDDGYEEGLIIVGGQTIKGIGGGVCQVSTTVFQAVFYAGFPMTERWAHGYMLGYYNDGEGPGMDATVYSPIVDFKFINNTPYHLLIENYYNQEEESLTFKFYSTSMGRRIEKSVPLFENIVPAPGRENDVWQYDEDMEPSTVRQIDWATEGADVTVARTVYNADDEIILQETFVSRYIPWANGYMYGPEVNAPDYSLVPPTR